ncbi:MAG: DUF177 domain-containing protein [Clostridia bacterium]|nr:DUF177 domain-containing protein [Clostridia bacterium]
MILDLTRLLSGEVNKINVDFELAPELEDGMTNALDGVEFTSPARVSGVVTDNAGYMRLSLEVSLDYRGECARCLRSIDDTLCFDFERTVVSEDTRQRDSESEEESEYSDEYVVLDDGKLDIDGQLREMLILEFPSKLLCSEDCKGLCIKCGHDLNESDCGCDRGYHDSRWDVLRGVKFAADADEEE